jgi:AraC family transcriptional regulator
MPAKNQRRPLPKTTPILKPKPKGPNDPIVAGAFTPQQKKAVDDFLAKNLGAAMRVEDVAKVVGFSPAHFNRLFRRTYRMSPHQMVIQLRVERAKEMIKKGQMSLADIAHETGFCDQSHLTHLFRRHFGVTPGKIK